MPILSILFFVVSLVVASMALYVLVIRLQHSPPLFRLVVGLVVAVFGTVVIAAVRGIPLAVTTTQVVLSLALMGVMLYIVCQPGQPGQQGRPRQLRHR